MWWCQRDDKAMNSNAAHKVGFSLRRKYRSNDCNRRTTSPDSHRPVTIKVHRKLDNCTVSAGVMPHDIQDAIIWPCDSRLRSSSLFGRGQTSQSTDLILSVVSGRSDRLTVTSQSGELEPSDWLVTALSRPRAPVLQWSFCCRAPVFPSFLIQLWSQLIQRREFLCFFF